MKEKFSCFLVNFPFRHLTIPCIFDKAMSFVNGLTIVRIDDLAICIDKQGRIKQKAKDFHFPINYHNRTFHEGLCAICFGRREWGVCDKSGKIITTEKFSKVSDFRNGIAEVYGRLGTCYINTDGVFVDGADNDQCADQKDSGCADAQNGDSCLFVGHFTSGSSACHISFSLHINKGCCSLL